MNTKEAVRQACKSQRAALSVDADVDESNR